MRELRLGIWIAVIGVLGYGCDNGNDGEDAGSHDSGMHTVTDSGPEPDSGPTPDSGTGTDGGSGGDMCGPLAGDCVLTGPSSCGTGMACLLAGDGMGGVMAGCTAAGTGVDGTACDPMTIGGQCAEGFGCSQEEAVCRRWCCADTDCDIGMGQICSKLSGTGPEGHLFGQCIQPDDCTLPPPQTGCPDGQECNFIGLDSGSGIKNCDAPTDDAHGEGEACTSRNDCIAGYTCVSVDAAGSSFVCRQYCDMTATTPCPAGFTCGVLTGAPTGVGVCVPAE